MTPSGYILLAISAGSEEACTIVLHEVTRSRRNDCVKQTKRGRLSGFAIAC